MVQLLPTLQNAVDKASLVVEDQTRKSNDDGKRRSRGDGGNTARKRCRIFL